MVTQQLEQGCQPVIDPHLHWFNFELGDYYWLKNKSLPKWIYSAVKKQSYTQDSISLSNLLELKGFVHIEAGFDNGASWREIEWLENSCNMPFKSIAYADIGTDIFLFQLERLKQFTTLAGIRVILEQAALDFFNNPLVVSHMIRLAESSLIFEAQFSLSDIASSKALCNLLHKIPELKVIITHAGNPFMMEQEWAAAIEQIAKLPNCYIKCSGWEMQAGEWQKGKIINAIYKLLEAFGVERLMLASNFPLSNCAISYTELWQFYLQQLDLAGNEIDQLFYQNAKRIYAIDLV